MFAGYTKLRDIVWMTQSKAVWHRSSAIFIQRTYLTAKFLVLTNQNNFVIGTLQRLLHMRCATKCWLKLEKETLKCQFFMDRFAKWAFTFVLSCFHGVSLFLQVLNSIKSEHCNLKCSSGCWFHVQGLNHTFRVSHTGIIPSKVREGPIIWKGHDIVIPPTMSFSDEANSVFWFQCWMPDHSPHVLSKMPPLF